MGSKEIRDEIDKLKTKMEELRRSGKYEELAAIQYGKLPELEKQLVKEEKEETKLYDEKPKLLRTQVGAEEIAEVVSRATGIPVSKMMEANARNFWIWPSTSASALSDRKKRLIKSLTPSFVLVPACPTRTVLMVPSSSSVRQASVRRSSPRLWPNSVRH